MPTQPDHYIETRPAIDRDNARLWTRSDCVAQMRELEFDRFSTIWNLPGDFIEPLNQQHGGWSGVTRYRCDDGAVDLLIKRQQNQQRRSWSFPLGAPTCRFEFEICRQLGDVPICHAPILYGQRDGELGVEALYISRSLPEKYAPLRVLLSNHADKPEKLIPAISRLSAALADMHRHGVEFGALIESKIWMDTHTGDCRLIDWERARFRRNPTSAALNDLEHLLGSSKRITPPLVDALLMAYTNELASVRDKVLRRFHH